MYRARVTVRDGRAVAYLGDIVGWGVETRLPREAAECCAEAGEACVAEPVRELEVLGHGARLRFAQRRSVLDRLRRAMHEAVAFAQGVVRRFLFITFFAIAYALAHAMSWLLDRAFDLWPGFALWVADHVGLTLTSIVLIEVVILLHLMARRIPAWIDNGYRHENRADNLGSLKRIGV